MQTRILFSSLYGRARVGSRDDLSRVKRVFFMKVQGPNSIVLPLLAHHPSTSPSGGFLVVSLGVILGGLCSVVRGISFSPQSRQDA